MEVGSSIATLEDKQGGPESGKDGAREQSSPAQPDAKAKETKPAAIMAQPDIDGALVGGASLDAGEFVRICRYRELVAET